MNPTHPQAVMNFIILNQLRFSSSNAVLVEKSRATIFAWSFEDLNVIVMSIVGAVSGDGNGFKAFCE